MKVPVEYSIVIPCYNEAENIPKLVSVFADFMSEENAELILVNNGSTDDTSLLKEEMSTRYPFVRWVDIRENIGYGNGIYQGLLQAEGRYLGYTHADLQTDPQDVKKAISIIKSWQGQDSFLVKGTRTGRSIISRLFSKTFEIMASMILGYKFSEVNAQPVVFSSGLMKYLVNPPLHWGFDLYVYYIAQKMNYQMVRMNVHFPKRELGVSKWQKGFLPRIKLSIKMLNYCFELKKTAGKCAL